MLGGDEVLARLRDGLDARLVRHHLRLKRLVLLQLALQVGRVLHRQTSAVRRARYTDVSRTASEPHAPPAVAPFSFMDSLHQQCYSFYCCIFYVVKLTLFFFFISTRTTRYTGAAEHGYHTQVTTQSDTK